MQLSQLKLCTDKNKQSGERQPLPIIREDGAPCACQWPAQTAGDRGGAPCSLPYSGGNNPRDSASKRASAHHNKQQSDQHTHSHTRTPPHHTTTPHTTRTRWVSVGRQEWCGWPARVNPNQQNLQVQSNIFTLTPDTTAQHATSRMEGGDDATAERVLRVLENLHTQVLQNLHTHCPVGHVT